MLQCTRNFNKQFLTAVSKKAHYLCLYVNDLVPTFKSKRSDFVEPFCESYVRNDLRGSWEIKKRRLVGKEQHFSLDHGQVYGYFVIDREGEVLWAERFSGAPFKGIRNNHFEVDITPTLMLD